MKKKSIPIIVSLILLLLAYVIGYFLSTKPDDVYMDTGGIGRYPRYRVPPECSGCEPAVAMFYYPLYKVDQKFNNAYWIGWRGSRWPWQSDDEADE